MPLPSIASVVRGDTAPRQGWLPGDGSAQVTDRRRANPGRLAWHPQSRRLGLLDEAAQSYGEALHPAGVP